MPPAPKICEPVGTNVFAVDTLHTRERADAGYLIVEGGRAALVDTGTHLSAPNFLKALADLDIDTECVEYILLTHIHLDHAGGAGRLATALKRARVAVHPRGVAHLADPSRLVAATKAVYGEAHFAAEFGDIVPIAATRIIALEDGQKIRLGARTLECIYTPGHALHHVCIADRDTGEVFSGDTFGVSYRECDTGAGEFIVTTTSPAQFDPAQLHASVERIAALAPRAIYVTHYGRLAYSPKLAADLHADIDVMVAIAGAHAGAADRVERMRAEILAHWSGRLSRHGFRGGEAEGHRLLGMDAALNAQGLDAWLTRTAA
jgi:glyoxylase-like metal-dependent hydrolase (beta-lactamase superfamily II)